MPALLSNTLSGCFQFPMSNISKTNKNYLLRKIYLASLEMLYFALYFMLKRLASAHNSVFNHSISCVAMCKVKDSSLFFLDIFSFILGYFGHFTRQKVTKRC